MIPSLRKIGSALIIVAAYPLAADVVRDTQSKLSEWISLEKRIADDQAEWSEQKEVLLNSIDFMEAEIARLKQSIETAEETASAGERKRAELEERKADLDAVSDDMKVAIETYEERIKSLATGWPEAFVSSIDTFLKRIPSEEQIDSAPLTLRLQNVVAILSQFDKFQSIITKDTGVKEVDGQTREVTTLYYGMAYAYFIDGSGEYAGYGHPNPAGGEWIWTADASLAPEISDLIAIFDRSVDATFVGLPAKIVTP